MIGVPVLTVRPFFVDAKKYPSTFDPTTTNNTYHAMNAQPTITSATGVHITSMTAGIVIRKIAGVYYVAHHFGQGETITHGRYRTEGGARRSARFIAEQSNTPIASIITTNA
jgi:hypothetical protein